MRDRQQISGGIGQQEVLSATCQNTATHAYVNNLWKSERVSTVAPESYVPLREAKTSSGTYDISVRTIPTQYILQFLLFIYI